MAAPQFAYGQPQQQQLFAQSGLQARPQPQQVLVLSGGPQQQQQLGGYAYGLNPYGEFLPFTIGCILSGAALRPAAAAHRRRAGVRVPAGPEVQQLYAHRRGGPAFFDSTSGVFFDGQQAYVYQAAPYGSRSSGSLLNVATAVPFSGNVALAGPGGQIILGNGTVGNLEEHRNARASIYILDNRI